MITYEEALKIIKENIIQLDTEKIELVNSLNRVLRENVYADMNMPPFNKSAMDGFACRKEDIKNELEIIESIQAGYKPQKIVGKNQCSKIMTGAEIPEGADCVIIVEDVEYITQNKIRYKKDNTSNNICYKGEDVKKGELLLTSGTRITEKEISSLAMSGKWNLIVSKKPKVGIISTGDEIVEPYEFPNSSQIRNTNAYQLIFQVEKFGCTPSYYGIIKDKEEEILPLISKAKEENDLMILTGGVSMGEYDLIPGSLKKIGFNLLFQKVQQQPGKPTVFGRDKNKFVFGMPGNPVSSFFVFEFFAKELLAGMLSFKNYYKEIQLELAVDYVRKRSERLGRIPIKIIDGKVFPIEYHGSAHINSLLEADGIVSIPIGVQELKKGTIVNVRSIW
ncbi:MAG: molybdopterin molybdotransferase MoeA [Melioribacteraceae bacterium]|nr:molybdopterin molybdotransferase MoeA [Melioribacteraceae bacterium]